MDLRNTWTGPHIREGRISVPGGRIWFKVETAGGKAPPIVTIHGGPGGSHDYLEPLGALADERPVIFYDQLGSGRSDHPEDTSLWNVKRSVDELHCVLRALRLDKVHLLGHSWGTIVAVEYVARKKPKEVLSLVLSAPALNIRRLMRDKSRILQEMPEELRRAYAVAEASGRFEGKEYEKVYEYYSKKIFCRLDEWPDCLKRTARKANEDVRNTLLGPHPFKAEGVLRNHDSSKKLGRISVPVLFVAGEHDYSTPEATMHYSGLVPGSEVVIIKGASHFHNLEKPDEFARIVRDFLHRHE